MRAFETNFEINQVLWRQGDPPTDLFFVQTGTLLALETDGASVSARRWIGPGEFLGELAFFDGKLHDSAVVAQVATKATQIPRHENLHLLPEWYRLFGKNLTKKIRLLEGLLQEHGVPVFDKGNQSLNSEDQEHYLKLITNESA